MTFYSEMADMAHEMLEEFGDERTLVLRRQTQTGSDYMPGRQVGTDYNVVGVVITKELDTVEGGRLIDARGRKVMLSAFDTEDVALAIEPAAGDLLIFDGKAWKVAAAAGVNPGGVTILYKLDVVI